MRHLSLASLRQYAISKKEASLRQHHDSLRGNLRTFLEKRANEGAAVATAAPGFFQQAWTDLKGAGSQIKQRSQDAWNQAKGAWTDGQGAKGVWGAAKQQAGGLWGQAKNMVSSTEGTKRMLRAGGLAAGGAALGVGGIYYAGKGLGLWGQPKQPRY